MKGEQIVVVLSLIVGVAVIAVIVSRNSNTPNVINALGGAFSTSLRAALTPVVNTQGL